VDFCPFNNSACTLGKPEIDMLDDLTSFVRCRRKSNEQEIHESIAA
jgi:hypothetical protein